MGLLTILRKLKQKENEMRVLFLGLDNAGKTTVLRCICGEDLGTVEPTLGFSIRTIQRDKYKLNCWDVGGQKSLRTYWRNYFEQTDALVWVVDSADQRRLDTCKEELRTLLQEERLSGATLLILANKQDVPGALVSAEIRQSLELDSITTHNWRIFATSAFENGNDRQFTENIVRGIDWLIEDVASRIFDRD